MITSRFVNLQKRLKLKHIITGAAGKAAFSIPLYKRLTTLHTIKQPYDGEPMGELFIHWYYRKRSRDELSLCEIFHLNMLQYFNVMDRVKVIHVRCASSIPKYVTPAMEKALAILSSGRAKVDFAVVDMKPSWEHDTFKECVEHAVSTGEFVYYTHFKGVSRLADPLFGPSKSLPRNSTALDVLYWCYMMYCALFQAPPAVKAIGPLIHLGQNKSYRNRDIAWSNITRGSEVYHYCGSFQAFDGNYIKECLDACDMSTIEARNAKLWVGDPYTVEMFLSLVSLKKDVYSLPVPYAATAGIYSAYTRHAIPQYEKAFEALYAGICIANWSFKGIGGSEVFSYALACALIKLGYTVYYHAKGMDGAGVTEKKLQAIGAKPWNGEKLSACFAGQNAGLPFIGKCPVYQTCHSALVLPEQPVSGMTRYVAISEEVLTHLQRKGLNAVLVRNGIDLDRFRPRAELRKDPTVLSLCQGDDTALRNACQDLGYDFISVPKDPRNRIWDIENVINRADIVVGIGRSLYDAMACGRCCISWDNRDTNPDCGHGYITPDNWMSCARDNFIGKGLKVDLVAELKKYDPRDGALMRAMAESELDVMKAVRQYLALIAHK